jgi:hypothetical protein
MFEMSFERYVLLYLAAIAVLSGFILIEIRRLRKLMERK